MSQTQAVRWIIKPLWFSACLWPFVWMNLLAFGYAGSGLGDEPLKETQEFMGAWALRLLIATLALTPIRLLTGQHWLVRLRRMTGLFALFYASMHLLNYLFPDKNLNWPEIVADVIERPFIALGMLAMLGMTLLGLTSTRGWQRRLGQRWGRLHRWVYAIAILACTHALWQAEAGELGEAITLSILLAALLWIRFRTRAGSAPN